MYTVHSIYGKVMDAMVGCFNLTWQVRDAVSAYFNAPDILIEFVDLTKRTGPTNHTLMGHLRTLIK